jgi:hypothetical protein
MSRLVNLNLPNLLKDQVGLSAWSGNLTQPNGKRKSHRNL